MGGISPPFNMKRLLDYNPITGEKVWFSDNQDGSFNMTHEQDVEPILEANKRLLHHGNRKKGIKKGFWHYASIPNILITKWSKEVGGDILSSKFTKELFKRINSRDYAHLKTTEGQHSPRKSS